MFEHRPMTDGEKREVARASIILRDMRAGNLAALAEFQHDGLHPETWWAYRMAGASPSSLTAEGAGPGDSAPDADLLDYQREGSDEDEDRRDLMAEYRPIGA